MFCNCLQSETSHNEPDLCVNTCCVMTIGNVPSYNGKYKRDAQLLSALRARIVTVQFSLRHCFGPGASCLPVAD